MTEYSCVGNSLKALRGLEKHSIVTSRYSSWHLIILVNVWKEREERGKLEGGAGGKQAGTLGLPDPPSVSRHSSPFSCFPGSPTTCSESGHRDRAGLGLWAPVTTSTEGATGLTQLPVASTVLACSRVLEEAQGALSSHRWPEMVLLVSRKGQWLCCSHPLREHQTISFSHTFHLWQDEGL